MKISVMGLGYVGAVSSACLAQDGNEVLGVDPSPAKVETVNSGESPIVEAGLQSLIGAAVRTGRLRATSDPTEAVAESDLSLICVGTPGLPSGGIDFEYLRTVGRQIGEAVRRSAKSHIVVVRSTVLPGTTRDIIIPALEDGLGTPHAGRISVAVNPEFLREGTAIDDYRNPAKTIIGSDDPECADTVAGLYARAKAPVFKTSVEVAEMAKYVDNAWHALKVTFANEMGWLSHRLGVDSAAVMQLFLADSKLNISPYYLRPGFAFGGSCLPKDVRALAHKARSLDLRLPVLENVLASNAEQIERVIKLIQQLGGRRVAFIGVTFKSSTDDLRESPFVEVVERIIGKGYDVRVYDPNVSLADIVGSNKAYAERMLPHLSRVLVDDAEAAIADADIVVVSHNTPRFCQIPSLVSETQTLLDLAGLPTRGECRGRYVGIV